VQDLYGGLADRPAHLAGLPAKPQPRARAGPRPSETPGCNPGDGLPWTRLL